MEQETSAYTKFCDFINKVIVPNEKEIFTAVTKRIAEEMGVETDDAFVDGTKFEANANKYKFVWRPTKYHKRLTAKAGEIIREHRLIDGYREEEFIKTGPRAGATCTLI